MLFLSYFEGVLGSPGKSQKKGQEDQGTFKTAREAPASSFTFLWSSWPSSSILWDPCRAFFKIEEKKNLTMSLRSPYKALKGLIRRFQGPSKAVRGLIRRFQGPYEALNGLIRSL